MRRAATAALAGQYVPAVAALGQWTGPRALPVDLCRWQGPRFPAQVALTFDDGPDPTATPAVLDRLDELGMSATFFAVGAAVERHPDIVEEIARRGHAVATHGYAHDHHLLRSPRWVRADLGAAGRVMASHGIAPTWYRPPYGQLTAATLIAARARGWRTVLWSAWGREWVTPDPGAVAARINRRLRPGAIVLLHDSDQFGRPGMWRTGIAALELVAAALERLGLATVTLDELVGGGPAAARRRDLTAAI